MFFLFIKEVIGKNIFWVSHKYCQGQGWNIKLRFFLLVFEVLKTKKISFSKVLRKVKRNSALLSSQHLFILLITNISYLIFLPLFVPSTLPPFSITFLEEKIGLVTSKPACWGWKRSEMISFLGKSPFSELLFLLEMLSSVLKMSQHIFRKYRAKQFQNTSYSRSLPLVAGKVSNYQVTATPRTLITWEQRQCPQSCSPLIAINFR